MMKTIRLGTRESQLAMAQSNMIIKEINKKYPLIEFELISMKTKGDLMLDTKLDLIGGKGLFVNELENALLSNEIDIAVHSMKDMPVYLPEQLMIAAVSIREDPRDVLVTLDGRKLKDLKEGSVIGTSSIRREVQLLAKRPDLKIKTLRGNVLTRINKLLNNEYDAIMLAAAGLKRLGLEERCVQYFDVDDVIPAVGQGILGVEIRKGDEIQGIINSINCEASEVQLKAERAFMVKLNGGCSTPIAAHAVLEGEHLKVYGMLATHSNIKGYRAVIEGHKSVAVYLGERLADRILELVKVEGDIYGEER